MLTEVFQGQLYVVLLEASLGIYIFSLSLLSSVPQVHRGVRQLARVRVRALRLPDPGHLDPVLHLHDSGPYCSKQMDKMRRQNGLKMTSFQVLALERYLAITKPIEYHNAIQERKETMEFETRQQIFYQN